MALRVSLTIKAIKIDNLELRILLGEQDDNVTGNETSATRDHDVLGLVLFCHGRHFGSIASTTITSQ
jgi:hypothetical protein